ncbi:hypothetical protein LSTR_LSTR016788 [Laodelphax striatellus]|uniref:FP protein C-terminal domain-containing protein n=1 Tax=Laodelphax striatellus TaxID=195883 RepID=A0A482WXK7_LAOST|nr:hypothetical protein LSTR_LSTR016788 [Laodelphax striatellus]
MVDATVSCCHRLKKKNNMSTAGIIVKFIRRDDAELFINCKKEKGNLTPKDIGLNGSNNIFINASLTAKRRILFGKAKLLLRSGKIKYLWVDRSGRVKARVVEGGPVTIIRSDNDLILLSNDSE